MGGPEAIEVVDDEPEVGAFRDALCDRLATLAPRLAQKIREETAGAESWGEVLLTASMIVAREEDGRDLDDLVGIDDLLRSFGVESVAGSEGRVDVLKSPSRPAEEILDETRKGVYRRRLHLACEGLMPMDRWGLLLSTNPLEAPFEVGLYNIAVIWLSEELFARMDKSSIDAQPSKAAKGREEKRLKGLAREQAVSILTEKGLINPAVES